MFTSQVISSSLIKSQQFYGSYRVVTRVKFVSNTDIMIYKERFIRNLVKFLGFYCSNSDVTRSLYVVKLRLVSKMDCSL